MKLTLTTIFTLSLFLLLSCGKANKPNNETTQADTDNAKTKKTEAKASPKQAIVRKWKQSFGEMYTKEQKTKLDTFELNEMKKAAENSFYEFKADGSYIITKPDEEPGKGKWEMSNDAKQLILNSVQGHKDVLNIEVLTSDKLKLKVKGFNEVLVLIPA